MKKIKIALAQVKSKLKNTEYNLENLRKILENIVYKKVDIICFPELFYTGHYLKREEAFELAEYQNGRFTAEVKKLAKEFNIHILAGYIEKTEIKGEIYNSCIFIDSQGEIIGNSRKNYLWGKEKLNFKRGNSFPVYNTNFGKIGILICYDNEYPEPARIMALKGAELIFAPSVWSVGAENRWNIQLSANALFNLFFVAGVNAVGEGICGSSQVFSPDGKIIKKASKQNEEILICDIDLDEIEKIRVKIPYFTDINENLLPKEEK